MSQKTYPRNPYPEGEVAKERTPSAPTTQQLGRALVAIAGLRGKLKEHLQMLPNAVNRNQLDNVFKESMRDLITQISASENL